MQEAAPRLGFIGTGILGSAMVQRLLRTGHPVTSWNREPERLPPLLTEGATAAASPRDVAAVSDIVMMCVLNTEAVSDCVWGPEGIAAADADRLIVDFSTISPAATRDFAARLAAAVGGAWLDAPVSGGPGAALAGTLAIMAGGDPASFARGKAVLDVLAGNVAHMGPVGAGQTTKIVNQAIVGTGFVLMAEALALTRAAGIDPTRVPACLAGGYADSPLLQAIYPRMAAADFDPPAGLARQLLKDMMAVSVFADAADVQLPLIATARDRFAQFVSQGNGLADNAAIIGLYE